MSVRKARYIVRLESKEHGRDKTTWDTYEEAATAVQSIVDTAASLNDGIARKVTVWHGRQMLRSESIGVVGRKTAD